MKHILWILLTLSLLIFACRAGEVISSNTITGSGNLIEESRTIKGVSKVELATSGTLYITLGDQESLTIKADENILPYIQTEVRGETLKIERSKQFNLGKISPLEYYLTAKDLQAITISSSGDVYAPPISADKFEISISSSGDVWMESLTAKTLKVNISSSGKLTIDNGEIDEQEINISSSGDYQARNVPCLQANVQLNSSGTATIRVQDRLIANLNSSGDLYYIGSPKLETNTNSSGRVIQIEE
jgi:hypothetical protein